MGRLHKAALLCALALLALPCGCRRRAGRRRARRRPRSVPRQHRADRARLLHRRRRGARRARRRPRPDGSPAQDRSEAAARLRLQRRTPRPPGPAVPGDPSTMPPASAGSNGTKIDGHSAAERQKIFANTRAGGGDSTSILLTGIALPPPDAPQAVKDVINNANAIVGRPYVWGGGHGSFYSYGYDCSGAVSFALFGGGMIPEPLTSGALEGWGAPGPGKWITVYANAGHTFAEIAGLRYDTSGTESGTGPRWHLEERRTTASSSATRRATEGEGASAVAPPGVGRPRGPEPPAATPRQALGIRSSRTRRCDPRRASTRERHLLQRRVMASREPSDRVWNSPAIRRLHGAARSTARSCARLAARDPAESARPPQERRQHLPCRGGSGVRGGVRPDAGLARRRFHESRGSPPQRGDASPAARAPLEQVHRAPSRPEMISKRFWRSAAHARRPPIAAGLSDQVPQRGRHRVRPRRPRLPAAGRSAVETPRCSPSSPESAPAYHAEAHATADAGRSAPGWIRTSDIRLRRPALYPAELRGLGRIV